MKAYGWLINEFLLRHYNCRVNNRNKLFWSPFVVSALPLLVPNSLSGQKINFPDRLVSFPNLNYDYCLSGHKLSSTLQILFYIYNSGSFMTLISVLLLA